MKPVATLDVLREIVDERCRQYLKWGEQNHPNGTGPHIHPLRGYGSFESLTKLFQRETNDKTKSGTVTFADILLEEVFEALAETDPAKLRTELIQVAAVAAQWVEAIDRRPGE